MNESEGPQPARAGRRGVLRLYVGYAPGVGKTRRMLEDACALRAAGTDVVAGFVDAHGCPDVVALLAGFERVPLRRVEFRGIVAEEMDAAAVLRRAPRTCLVDDVPHTNAPGAGNLRRHEDVEDLLAAGIDVMATLDAQHLEGVADVAARATGVAVRETVPDAFLRGAGRVVAVDLPVEDLLERVRSGRVDPRRHGAAAPASLYRADSLRVLRELALREVAESLVRAPEGAPPRVAAARAVSGRVLVCLASASPRALQMIRRAARIAGRLNTDWFVLHAEVPGDARRADPEVQRALSRTVDAARALGAEVAVVAADDPVAAVVDFARAHGVAHVIVGRTGRAGWRRALRRTFVDRLLDEAEDLDVHVVAAEIDEDAAGDVP